MGKTLLFDSNPVLVASSIKTETKETSWNKADAAKILIDKMWLTNCESYISSLTYYHRGSGQTSNYYIEISQDDFATSYKSLNYSFDKEYDDNIFDEEEKAIIDWRFNPIKIDKSKNLYIRAKDLNGTIIELKPILNARKDNDQSSAIFNNNQWFNYICKIIIHSISNETKNLLTINEQNIIGKLPNIIETTDNNELSIISSVIPHYKEVTNIGTTTYDFITTKSLALSKIDQVIQVGQDAEIAKQESISAKNTAVSAKTDAVNAKADAENAKILAETAKDESLKAALRAAQAYLGAANSADAAEGFAGEAQKASLGEAIVPRELKLDGVPLKHNYKYIVTAESNLDLTSVSLEDNATCELWMDFKVDPTTITNLKLPHVYWLDGTSSTGADEHDIPYLPSTICRCHYVIREEVGLMVGHMAYYTPIPESN